MSISSVIVDYGDGDSSFQPMEKEGKEERDPLDRSFDVMDEGGGRRPD